MKLILNHLTEESAADFPRLRRIPSTGIISLIDYYSELPSPAQAELLASLAARAAGLVGPVKETVAPTPPWDAWLRASQSPAYSGGYRYSSLKLIAMMRRDAQSHALLDRGHQRPPRPDLLPDPSNFIPAKAPLLKKLVRSNEHIFSIYAVEFDFRSRLTQLRYGVPCGGPIAIAYEQIWGVPSGWDYLTEENAARSIDLLPELVESMVILAG